MNIEQLPGLEDEQVARLHRAGMRTCRQLLRANRKQGDSITLTQATDLQPKDLVQIVRMAELGEIGGIGPASLHWLLEAGCGSTVELATEEPQALQTKLREAGAKPPNLAVLEHWILQARRRTGGNSQGVP